MTDNMQELKGKQIWMLWRWETKPDGKRTKVPMSASGGPCGTDEKWSSSWATYDEAATAKEKISNAAGIGFKIPEDFYFIDIDDRELTDPLVQTIFSRHDSYAEYSISGTGIHQYGKCDFTKVPTYTDKNGKLCLDRQFYQKNPNNKMELYIGGITNRFAVYTGNVIEDKPLRECTAAILTTLDKDMRRKPKVKYSEKQDGKRELEQAQARIQKLDEIIQRLYEDNVEGKISDERFVKMSASYEEEQKGLESRVSELKKLIAAEKENSVNVDRFLSLVRKYTDVKELTAEIIREFVEKIYVHQSERIDGQKVQRIRIVWNCIGEFTPPTITDIEKSA